MMTDDLVYRVRCLVHGEGRANRGDGCSSGRRDNCHYCRVGVMVAEEFGGESDG